MELGFGLRIREGELVVSSSNVGGVHRSTTKVSTSQFPLAAEALDLVVHTEQNIWWKHSVCAQGSNMGKQT
jgi:hypothetical protein